MAIFADGQQDGHSNDILKKNDGRKLMLKNRDKGIKGYEYGLRRFPNHRAYHYRLLCFLFRVPSAFGSLCAFLHKE